MKQYQGRDQFCCHVKSKAVAVPVIAMFPNLVLSMVNASVNMSRGAHDDLPPYNCQIGKIN